MLLRKKGFPEENELVLCTVTKIQPNGVFAALDEYEEKIGLIHIPEVSPGRIRNLADFVVEGKKIVCLVIRIDLERKHIDISLRRVSEQQRRRKIDSIKQEQKAEKIIEFVAKKLNTELNDFYKRISEKIIDKYENLYLFFEDIVEGKASFEKLDLKPEEKKELEEVIFQRIKPQEVELTATINLVIYNSNGVELIKEMFGKIVENNIHVKYTGGGKYSLTIKSREFKEAEKILEATKKKIDAFMKDKQGTVAISRK